MSRCGWRGRLNITPQSDPHCGLWFLIPSVGSILCAPSDGPQPFFEFHLDPLRGADDLQFNKNQLLTIKPIRTFSLPSTLPLPLHLSSRQPAAGQGKLMWGGPNSCAVLGEWDPGSSPLFWVLLLFSFPSNLCSSYRMLMTTVSFLLVLSSALMQENCTEKYSLAELHPWWIIQTLPSPLLESCCLETLRDPRHLSGRLLQTLLMFIWILLCFQQTKGQPLVQQGLWDPASSQSPSPVCLAAACAAQAVKYSSHQPCFSVIKLTSQLM